jgi:hypothetical protein
MSCTARLHAKSASIRLDGCGDHLRFNDRQGLEQAFRHHGWAETSPASMIIPASRSTSSQP